MSFKKTDIYNMNINPFKMIGKDWFLLSAGNINDYNMMTASWGEMGVIWGDPSFTTVVRPNRYTYEYMEKNDLFAVTFFDGEQREALNFCGSHSGRDCDKAKESKLTPIELDGVTTFEEAKVVFICKKLYAQDLAEEFIKDKDSVLKWYGNDPYHRAYTGAIVSVYVNE